MGSIYVFWICKFNSLNSFSNLRPNFNKESLILSSGWFLLLGFVGFLITGHLYKIIPFLVWFEKYAPLVGKEKVPMLNEMYPKKLSNYQFYFTSLGVVITGLALF